MESRLWTGRPHGAMNAASSTQEHTCEIASMAQSISSPSPSAIVPVPLPSTWTDVETFALIFHLHLVRDLRLPLSKLDDGSAGALAKHCRVRGHDA